MKRERRVFRGYGPRRRGGPRHRAPDPSRRGAGGRGRRAGPAPPPAPGEPFGRGARPARCPAPPCRGPRHGRDRRAGGHRAVDGKRRRSPPRPAAPGQPRLRRAGRPRPAPRGPPHHPDAAHPFALPARVGVGVAEPVVVRPSHAAAGPGRCGLLWHRVSRSSRRLEPGAVRRVPGTVRRYDGAVAGATAPCTGSRCGTTVRS